MALDQLRLTPFEGRFLALFQTTRGKRVWMLNLRPGILLKGLVIALLVVFGSQAQAGRPMPWLEGLETLRLKIGVSEDPKCPIEKEGYYKTKFTNNIINNFDLNVKESDDVDIVFYFVFASTSTVGGECVLRAAIRVEQVMEEELLRHNDQTMNPVIVMFHEDSLIFTTSGASKEESRGIFMDYIDSIYEEIEGNR